MKHLFYTTLLTAAVTFSSAANWDGSTDGNWNIGANWSTNTVPGSGEAAFLRINGTIFQNAQTRTVGRIAMGINDQTPTLNVGQNGGTITTGDGTTTQNNFGQNSSGTSTFNLLGGGFTASNMSHIGAGTGNMQFNVSGGALNLADLNVATSAGSSSSLNVIGDTATLQVGRTTFGSGGTLKFEFGSAGVSSLSLKSLTAAGATLLVDLTNYTGANGTFTIVSADSDNAGIGFESVFSTATITEGAYAGSSINQDLASNEITLTIVPEPGTYALMGGLMALCYVMLRRRYFAAFSGHGHFTLTSR